MRMRNNQKKNETTMLSPKLNRHHFSDKIKLKYSLLPFTMGKSSHLIDYFASFLSARQLNRFNLCQTLTVVYKFNYVSLTY